MTLQLKDFHSQLEYDTYYNTKIWTIKNWSDFRNKFFKDYYEQKDKIMSLINNKEGCKNKKFEGNTQLKSFNYQKLNMIKKFNIENKN